MPKIWETIEMEMQKSPPKKQKKKKTIAESLEEELGMVKTTKKDEIAQLQAELESGAWRQGVPTPSREAVMRHQIGTQTPVTPQPQKQQKSPVLDRALAALSLLGPGFALTATQQAKKKQSQAAKTTQPIQPTGPPPSTGEVLKTTLASGGKKGLLTLTDFGKLMADVATGQIAAHPKVDELLSIPREKWDPELRTRIEPLLPKQKEAKMLGRTFTLPISAETKKKIQAELDKWWDEKAALYEQAKTTRQGLKEWIAEDERRMAGATPVQKTIYQVGSELPTQLAQIVATGLSGGSMVPLGLSATASTMAELEEQGVPYKERLARSVASGLIEAGTERISVPEWIRYFKGVGGDRLIREGAQEVAQQGFKTLGQWAKRTVMQWAKGAAGEVGEELVADPLHNLADILILGEKKPIWTAEQAGETALQSGVMSLLLGALGLPAQFKSYQMAKQMLSQDKIPTMERTEQLRQQMVKDMAEAGKAAPEAEVTTREEGQVSTEAPAPKLPGAVEVLKQHPKYGKYNEETYRDLLVDDYGAWRREVWQAVAQSPEYKDATVFMIDANSFKDANDLFGHPFGDRTLQGIINLFKDAGIEIYRPGGDEFSFFTSTPEQGRAIMELVRGRNLVLEDSDGTVYRVPAEKVISYGEGSGYESADKALYTAKKGKYTGPYGSIWREIKAEPGRFTERTGGAGGAVKGTQVPGVRAEEVTPLPETPATLTAQMGWLQEGKRKAVLVTPGETMPKVPEGIKTFKTKQGTFLYRPDLIKPKEITQAVKEDRIGDILGYGISSKPSLEKVIGVVTIRGKDGIEKQAVATDQEHLDQVMAAAKELAGPDDTVQLESALETIAKRVATTKKPSELASKVAPVSPAKVVSGTRIRLKSGIEHTVREVLPNGNIVLDDGTTLGPAEVSGWTVVEAKEVSAQKSTVTPKVGGTYTVHITQSTGNLKEGQEFTGKVNRIFRVKSGAVLAELESADGTKRNIPVSKYAEWREAKKEVPTVEQQAAEQAKKTKETAEMPVTSPEITPPSGKQITPIQRTAIIAYIEKHLKAPIRNKRLLSPKAAGQFHEQTGVIRLRTPEDLQTLAHETGHNLTKMLNLDYESYDELEPLGAALYPNYSSKLKRKEGLAEFFRRYLINPAEAKEVAPKFYEAFEKRIEQDPEIAKAIREVQQMYHDYYTADAVNYVKSHIVYKQPFEQRPFLTRAEKWYTDWFDDLYPIRKAVALLTNGQASQDWVLEMTKDSYILARLARAVDRAAYAQLVHGMVGPDLKFKGKSLREILTPIRDRIEDFEAYLIARRAVELEDYGIKSGFDKDKAQEALKKLSTPEFEKAAKEFDEFQDNLLDWLVESDAISKQTAEIWRQIHKAYIPFYRVFGEETYVGTGKAGKYADISAPIKSIKGSSRSVWSPIQSVVRNTYFYMTVAKHNMVAKTLYEHVANAKDMGWLAEILPTPVQPDQIELSRLKKELIEAGIPKDKLEEVDLNRVALIFNPVRFARGKEAKENILTIRVGGEVKFIQVHPELYRALKGLDVQAGHWFISLLARATRILKPGILLSPNFAFRNIVRDTGNRLLTTKGKIWEMPWSIIKGLYHVIGKTDKYIEAEVAGAFQSTRVSLSRDELREHAMRVVKPSLAEKFNPLRWLEYVLEVSEEASKMGEYLMVERQKGKLAAAYAARESGLDFARAGIKGREANKIIAFFNAALQGPDKLVREAKANPGRFLIRGTLLTMVSLAIMAARYQEPEDEKRFEEEPRWKKDLYWIVYTDDGTPIYIPKPFEAGVLFASSVERILEYQKTKDPKVFKDLMVSMAEALTPDILLTAYTPFLETWANKSFFTGRPIVPMSEQRLPEALQYGPRTTETAKMIGKALRVSPRKVEHLIVGYTGTMGTHAMDFLDLLVGKALEKKTPLELIPGPRGFTGAPLAASASVDRLYEELNKLEKDYTAFNKGLGKQPDIARLYQLRLFAKVLSSLRKEADNILRTPMKAEVKREKLREIDLKMANIARMAYGKEPIK